MRHLKSGRRLGRTSAHRKAMYRNMSTSLLLQGRIQTTEAKAKELRSVVEKLISLGKRVPPSCLDGLEGDALTEATARRIHAMRLARRTVQDRDALQLLFNEYSERYQKRPGGYTRILKLGRRPGDNAPMSLIELVEDSIDDAPVQHDDAGESGEASSEE